jgi:hypothetical protein
MNPNTFAIQKPEYNLSAELPSLRNTGRVAGLLYLVIIVAGIFAFFIVRGSLVVPGDAAATASNIAGSESFFRVGIAADLVMILCDVAVGLIFYILLRPVSNGLALLAAFFRLVQAAMLGVNLLNLFIALQFLSGAAYLGPLGADQTQRLALVFLEVHGIGYSISMVFFAFSLLVLGYLIFKSGYMPRLLGGLLVVAAVGYLTDSFAGFLLPNYADFAEVFQMIVFAPALIAELSLAVWLIIRGVSRTATHQAVAER